MQFTNNPDGSLTISASLAAVAWAGSSVLAQSSGNGFGSLSGSLPILPYDGKLVPYAGHLCLHVQYGTSSADTVTDHYISVNLGTLGYDVVISGGTQQQVVSVTNPGGDISYTVSAAELGDARAAQGIYATAYVDVEWGPVADPSIITSSGYAVVLLDSGTNAPTGMSIPPYAPESLSGTVNSDLSVNLSWYNSAGGTAPVAGYTVSWGMTAGGPYPNSQSFPITTHLWADTNTFSATIPGSNFAQDGLPRYFVVTAYDDGTAPDTPSYTPASTIIYWPTPDPITPAAAPISTGSFSGNKPSQINPHMIVPQ